MKIKSTVTAHAVGNYSRHSASPWTSRAWLDKPLPLARHIGQRLLAAAEPALAPIYWATLKAKSKLDDERANREGSSHGRS